MAGRRKDGSRRCTRRTVPGSGPGMRVEAIPGHDPRMGLPERHHFQKNVYHGRFLRGKACGA